MRSSAELFAALLISSIVLIYAGYILTQWNKIQNTMFNVNEWLQNRMSLSAAFVLCHCNLTLTLSSSQITAPTDRACICYAYNSPDLNEYYARGRLASLLLLDQNGSVVGALFLKGYYSTDFDAIVLTPTGESLTFGNPLDTSQVALVLYKGELELPLFCINVTAPPTVEVRTCSG